MNPTLKKSVYFLVLIALMFSANFSFSQGAGEIEDLTNKIKSAQNAEELYSIRYNIDRYIKRSDLSLDDERTLNRAYIMLSAAFKSKNHFKNAADVYKDYLAHQEIYLRNYNLYLQDSIKASQKKLSDQELLKINELDAEIVKLKKSREAVAGLKTKYYSTGSIAAIAIVVIFLIIFITRNRAIRLTTNQLNTNQAKLLEMNGELLKSRMIRGSVHFGKQVAVQNIELIETILATSSEGAESKSVSKERESLKKAAGIFSNLKG